MVKEIVKDKQQLTQPSRRAEEKDRHVVQDLKDTFLAQENCLGMAANMIGECVRIVLIQVQNKPLILINPEVVRLFGRRYTGTEGCLSLTGLRDRPRYEKIQVNYTDEQGRRKQRTFAGLPAQALQHQLDHCEGILV